jgi:hypothetical protein
VASSTYKAGAAIAQRAGDVETRSGQIHVYHPLVTQPHDGYWPAGELIEGVVTTCKWQEQTPTLSQTCAVLYIFEVYLSAMTVNKFSLK